MPKTTDGKIALIALVAFAAWLLVGLPLLYFPGEGNFAEWFEHHAGLGGWLGAS